MRIKKNCVFLLGVCLIAVILNAGKVARIEKLINNGRIVDAQLLCAQLKGFDAAWTWPLLGDWFFRNGDLDKALECYGKGVPVIGLARTWCRMADQWLAQGEKERALDGYGRGLLAFETLIRDDRCLWSWLWNNERLLARKNWLQLGGRMATAEEQERLQRLLIRAAAYSQQLAEALLRYVCEEEVVETFELANAQESKRSSRRDLGRREAKELFKSRVFDYQLIREKNAFSENRRLLLVDGHPAHLQITNELQVSHYRIDKIIYAPIELFGSGQNQFYEYRLLEERADESGPLFIVEVLPLVYLKPVLPFGRAWLRKNGRVERIELNFKSIQDYEKITQRARGHQLMPAITFVACFEKEYKGIGFPSALHMQDAFINEKGKESIVSRSDITYRKYSFFIVDTSVELQETE